MIQRVESKSYRNIQCYTGKPTKDFVSLSSRSLYSILKHQRAALRWETIRMGFRGKNTNDTGRGPGTKGIECKEYCTILVTWFAMENSKL
jgi:hypothetical protein